EQIAAGVVSVTVLNASKAAGQLQLGLEIVEGFHINAHDACEGLIATTLSATGAEIEVDYPPGEEQRFAFADRPIRVYEKSAQLAVRIKSAPSGRVTFRLTYQACTDNACLPAVTKQFEWRPAEHNDST